MTSIDKIAIILDTCVAHPKNETCGHDKLHIKNYDDLIGFIERRDLVDNVDVLLPEIVLNEITEQRIQLLQSDIANFKNLGIRFQGSNLLEMNALTENINPRQHAEGLKDLKLKEVLTIPIPTDKLKLFENIYKMALRKEPPFRQNKSDSGFKDAILMLSITNYLKVNKYNQAYLFTNDGALNSMNKDYIQKHHKIDIEITKDNPQTFLANLFRIKIELRDQLEEGSFYSDLQKKLKRDIVKRVDTLILPNGKKCELDNIEFDNYTINEVNDQLCDVYYPVSLKVHYNDGQDQTMKITIKMVFKKENDIWFPAQYEIIY